MLLDAFTPHLNLGILAMLILALLLIDSNIICSDPRTKAKRIIRLFSVLNKQKREINKLLTITIQVKELKQVLGKLLIAEYILYTIINRLDDNSKTKSLKESLRKQITELDVLEIRVLNLLHKKQDNASTIDVYDDIMEILKLYRPIYTKIHKHTYVGDILL